ncbi:hypothetical protein AT5G45455 [Arabidopsis thaliana]|uniref:Uncharacterized protein n=1 Tax=Arabidopsis thaliana TaxID=3702 RepID=A0A1P8BCS3_ARATH|nr:uncharacterized protein AT5G45455 [Arabidopsis thaliana]ANM69392.1 hypothetical protein AT5G45455 [Arabidopsis thaliana]|eukprot:NP_001331074.1 hypothetical protein AT5G45455 [Arabidopsis thaliana]
MAAKSFLLAASSLTEFLSFGQNLHWFRKEEFIVLSRRK